MIKHTIKLKLDKEISVSENGMYRGKVVKSGNGAVIPFYKKFLNKEVIIIMEDETMAKNKKDKQYEESEHNLDDGGEWKEG